MIHQKEIIKYFKSKSYLVNEFKGQNTLLIVSPEGKQLVLTLKKKYCKLFLYFNFKLNADFFDEPFNWKIEFYRMLMHIELNKITDNTKTK